MTDFKQQTLTVIRGVPGSGKSTLAETIQYSAAQRPHANIPEIVEMDDWRKDEWGNYVYNEERNREIAQLCFSRVAFLLGEGHSVIVCNLFLKPAQLQIYKSLARKLNIQYIEIITNSEFDSIHGVSRHEIMGMRKRIEVV